MAVGAGAELRHGCEPRIGRSAMRERGKAARTHRLIAIHLRRVGLVHGPCTDILSPQIDRGADLVFHREAPLHEIGRVQLSIRHGRDGHGLQTRIRTGERRCARKLAAGKARLEDRA
jgi:hypothetical protein